MYGMCHISLLSKRMEIRVNESDSNSKELN